MLANRVLVSVVAMGVVLAALVVRAQQRSSPSLVGVWKIVEGTGPSGQKVTDLQPTLHIYTPRYFSVMDIRSQSPRPELPPPFDKASDKQVADSVRPFVARAGTYEAKGNEIIYQSTVAKVPNVMKPGFLFIETFKFEGNDTLMLTEKTGAGGPTANPATLKLTRL